MSVELCRNFSRSFLCIFSATNSTSKKISHHFLLCYKNVTPLKMLQITCWAWKYAWLSSLMAAIGKNYLHSWKSANGLWDPVLSLSAPPSQCERHMWAVSHVSSFHLLFLFCLGFDSDVSAPPFIQSFLRWVASSRRQFGPECVQ